MWHKTYGQTGKNISVIGFGGMRFANPDDIDSNAEIVMHAYNKGVNYFDTAPKYCKDHSEEIVGAAVAQMKPGTFYVSTKSEAESADGLRADLERSLKRLNVEKINFYHIWCIVTLEKWKKRRQAVSEALKAKQEGLIEHLVVSSHLPGDDLKELLAEGIFEGVTLGYCAINFPAREVAVEAAGRMGIGVVTMNPLSGGLIPNNAERFDFIRSSPEESVVEAALRFNVSNPNITSALVGFTTKQHVDEAVAAVEDFHPYSAEHIDRMRSNILGSFQGLCTCCGYCLPCPEGINVRAMMDAYNMKILSNDDDKPIFGRLKWHWQEDIATAKNCTECGACEDKCTQHLPIRDRMKHLAELADKQE